LGSASVREGQSRGNLKRHFHSAATFPPLAIFAPLITIGAAAFLEARYSILQLRLGQQLRLATFHPSIVNFECVL
jgi:hypothetical protein